MENLVEIIDFKNLIIFLIVINVIGFLAMGIDKHKAKKGYWRISEATLMTICFLGGGIGTITGMYKFRHKTKKLKFTIGMPTILICEIVIIIYFLVKYVLVPIHS